MPARSLTALAALSMLAACSGAQQSPTPAASVAQPHVPAPADAALPEQPDVRRDVRVAPPPVQAPDTLIGLAPGALDNLLGTPNLIRQDGPAEVRLYRAGENMCTFHVFLYQNGPSSRSRAVEHVEARDASGRIDGAAMKTCYRALVAPATVS